MCLSYSFLFLIEKLPTFYFRYLLVFILRTFKTHVTYHLKRIYLENRLLSFSVKLHPHRNEILQIILPCWFRKQVLKHHHEKRSNVTIMPSVLDMIQNLHLSEPTLNATLLKWEADKRNWFDLRFLRDNLSYFLFFIPISFESMKSRSAYPILA